MLLKGVKKCKNYQNGKDEKEVIGNRYDVKLLEEVAKVKRGQMNVLPANLIQERKQQFERRKQDI